MNCLLISNLNLLSFLKQTLTKTKTRRNKMGVWGEEQKMGVWGKTRFENNIRFILHYKAPLNVREELSIIDTLVVLDQDKSVTSLDVEILKEKYIGKTLSEIQG